MKKVHLVFFTIVIFLISFNQNEDSFDEKTWDSLYKISQKTFVDETESSKKTSAGAGLTDND